MENVLKLYACDLLTAQPPLVEKLKAGAACAAPAFCLASLCQLGRWSHIRCQLEDELHCQLYIAALDVAVGRHALNGSDEPTRYILSARSDVEICMVKGVE